MLMTAVSPSRYPFHVNLNSTNPIVSLTIKKNERNTPNLLIRIPSHQEKWRYYHRSLIHKPTHTDQLCTAFQFAWIFFGRYVSFRFFAFYFAVIFSLPFTLKDFCLAFSPLPPITFLIGFVPKQRNESTKHNRRKMKSSQNSYVTRPHRLRCNLSWVKKCCYYCYYYEQLSIHLLSFPAHLRKIFKKNLFREN